MSGLRGRALASHTITLRILIGIVLSLIVVASICTVLTFPRALAASIVSDDFNDNSLDTAKWDTNLFSGFTNTNLPLAETGQRLEIGPLVQNINGSSYRGIRTVSSYNFSGAYTYVELVKAPEVEHCRRCNVHHRQRCQRLLPDLRVSRQSRRSEENRGDENYTIFDCL